MEGYKVAIKECSRELTPRERIMVKDTSNAIKLDEAAGQIDGVNIEVFFYAVLNIHNEKSEDKDYENYIVIDKKGNKFVTGSPSFWSAFVDIADEMGDEDFTINCYKLDSKNYKGKQFLTCSIV